MDAFRGSAAALMAMQLSLAACSTQQIARFESNVGAMRCAKFGELIEGTYEHQQCVADYSAVAEQERADTRAAMLGAAGAATQVWSAEQQGRAQAQVGLSAYARVYRLREQWWNAGKRMCQYADGSILNVGTGSCPAEVTASR